MADPYRDRAHLGDFYWPVDLQTDATFSIWPFLFSKVIVDGWRYRLIGCRWFIILIPAGPDAPRTTPEKP